jgi:ribonucleoside-triphosphate reductase
MDEPVDGRFFPMRVCGRGVLGLYQGVNFDLTTCEDCGWNDENDTEVCPECGSHDISTIVRNCGYLSLSRTKGSTRLNESKLAEVLDRVSM